MINISFIGNCQTASLCFYFQQLLDSNMYHVSYIMYGEEFRMHLSGWSHKVNNKITNYDESINTIKNSDIIIYQEIVKEKSLFSNTETLKLIKKESCKLIMMPCIYLVYSNFDISIKELRRRELENKVDLIISDILEKYRDTNHMLTIHHPNTFLFLEIVNEICKIINIDTFSENKRNIFLQNPNYMNLPT